jgi:hypothetical protein
MNRPLGFSPRVSEYRDEFLREIRRSPPKYVLVANEKCFFSFDKPAPELLEDFPDFADFLASHYSSETAIGIYDVLRRVDANPLTALRKEL